MSQAEAQTGTQARESFCDRVIAMFPDIRWSAAQQGTRFITSQAVMTCESSSATISTNVPFSPAIRWDHRQGVYSGVIPPNQVLVLHSDDAQTTVTAELVKIRGRALISRDVEAIVTHNLTAIAQVSARQGRAQQVLLGDLGTMQWRPLVQSDVLSPWDMIWTGETGRTEVEVTISGPEYVADAAADVRSADGKPTRRKRFFENSVFVMVPAHYRSASVVAVLGEVMISRDRGEVRRFVKKHGILSGGFGPPVDEPIERRIERLSKPMLE